MTSLSAVCQQTGQQQAESDRLRAAWSAHGHLSGRDHGTLKVEARVRIPLGLQGKGAGQSAAPDRSPGCSVPGVRATCAKPSVAQLDQAAIQEVDRQRKTAESVSKGAVSIFGRVLVPERC